jgi:hypothetical protein
MCKHWVGCLRQGLLIHPVPNRLDYSTCYGATVKYNNLKTSFQITYLSVAKKNRQIVFNDFRVLKTLQNIQESAGAGD